MTAQKTVTETEKMTFFEVNIIVDCQSLRLLEGS